MTISNISGTMSTWLVSEHSSVWRGRHENLQERSERIGFGLCLPTLATQPFDDNAIIATFPSGRPTRNITPNVNTSYISNHLPKENL